MMVGLIPMVRFNSAAYSGIIKAAAAGQIRASNLNTMANEYSEMARAMAQMEQQANAAFNGGRGN